MAEITLEHLYKRYPNGFEAVKDLSLEIAEAELLVLVGPSGCGKTTALRMIAGLEGISSGDLYIGGRRVNNVLEKDRDIAMVFQNYALYPHMTVAQNIAFSLKLARTPKDELKRRVRETAQLLGLEELLDRRPKQLSGGQRQRVAMGRAIVRQPQAFLMDEPLSNLDAQLRVHMRGEIEELQKQLGVTTVYVTHDQIEAMTMGDRVAVLRSGELQQVDTPTNVYDRPVNLFVAGFMGSPPMNLARATIARDDGDTVVRLGGETIPLQAEWAKERKLDEWVGRSVIVGIRPEDLKGQRDDGRLAPLRDVGRHDRPCRGARGKPLGVLHRRRRASRDGCGRGGNRRWPRRSSPDHTLGHALLRDLRAAGCDPRGRPRRREPRRTPLALLRPGVRKRRFAR